MSLRPVLRSVLRPVLRSPMQRGGGIAGFSPLSLFAGGEQGSWYDPYDINSMYQDSAGTTPAVVGQPVGKILDKSGRGNHLIQATSAARPTLQVDGNGKNYLSFDGFDDGLATSGTVNFTATDKMTVWAGTTMTASGGVVVALGAPFGNAGTFVVYAGAASANAFSVGSTGTTFKYAHGGSTAPPKTRVVTGQADIAGASILIRENAAQTGSNLTTQGTGSYSNSTLWVGCEGGGGRLNGNIYQLIIRGAASDAAQITSAETFVNSKTGAY